MKIERWSSDQGSSEIHYFIEKEGMKETYFFGINPKIFTPKQIELVLHALHRALAENEEKEKKDGSIF